MGLPGRSSRCFSAALHATFRPHARRGGPFTGSAFLQTLYWLQFILFYNLVTFPLTAYEGFFREHQYNLSNQTFAARFRDQTVVLALLIIFGGPTVSLLFAVVRRLPRTWHIWGTGIAVVFIALVIFVAPVFIVPLFNTPDPLADSPIKVEILSLADANGISARDVYQVTPPAKATASAPTSAGS